MVDIRFEDQVEAAVAKTLETFGQIDILVNNASAIHLTDTVSTPMKRYDLMHHINTRGTFLLRRRSERRIDAGLFRLIRYNNEYIENRVFTAGFSMYLD